LIAALVSDDKAAALSALREMGVLALCPSRECVFARMQLVSVLSLGLRRARISEAAPFQDNMSGRTRRLPVVPRTAKGAGSFDSCAQMT
jgi:hypothetical protein